MADAEFRIVIIGKSQNAKSNLSDLITSQKTFLFKNTEERSIAHGVWRNIPVKVVKCPDVLGLPVLRVKQEVTKCFAQHPSGPNVLLLIVNPLDFTEDDRQRLGFIFSFFRSEAFSHSLVIMTRSSGGPNPVVNRLVQDCGQRQHRMDLDGTEELGSDVDGLMEKIDQMVRDDTGQCLNTPKRAECLNTPKTAECLNTPKRAECLNTPKRAECLNTPKRAECLNTPNRAECLNPPKRAECLNTPKRAECLNTPNRAECLNPPKRAECLNTPKRAECLNTPKRGEPQRKQECAATKPHLNLVLCGRFEVGKKSTAQAILGKLDFNPSEGSKHEAEVCGRSVTLAELPSMCRKSQNTCRQDMLRCISLFDAEGVHGFIHVLPLDPPTDEDKEDMMTFQNTAPSCINDFSIIAFAVESNPTNQLVVNFVKTNRQIQELCQSFGGRYVVLNINNREQIPQLLETVDKMKATKPGGFTKEMITKPRKLSLSQFGGSYTTQSVDPLRMVLIGKTGSGKSATANTILGKDCFYSSVSETSVTKICKKEKGVVDGRPVYVVDTPGLFDTSLSNEEVKQELLKCISLLAPGPHVFLLVIQIGRMTRDEQDTVGLIKEFFGHNSEDYVIIILTRGDDLENQTVESYMQKRGFLKKLADDCGGRYHVLNNKDKSNHTQVSQLMEKVESLVQKNSGRYYTSEIFQEAKAAIDKEMLRIMKVKVEEMEIKLRERQQKYTEELEELKNEVENQRREREKLLLEKELILQKEEEKKIQERRDEEQRKQEEEHERQKKQEVKRTQSVTDFNAKRHSKFTNEDLHIPKATVKTQKDLWESRDAGGQQRKQEEELERQKKQEVKRTQSVRDFNGKRNLKFTNEDLYIPKAAVKTLTDSWESTDAGGQQTPEGERQALKKLREEFEQLRNAHEDQKIQEDQMTREEEQRRLRELQRDARRTELYMNYSGVEEARRQAEDVNEFKQRYTENFDTLKHRHEQEIKGLKEQQQLFIERINTKPANKKDYDTLMKRQKEEMDELRAGLPPLNQLDEMQKKHEEQIKTWIREKIKDSPRDRSCCVL